MGEDPEAVARQTSVWTINSPPHPILKPKPIRAERMGERLAKETKFQLNADSDREAFEETLKHTVELARQAKGGTAFLVAAADFYKHAKGHNVEFPVVDKSAKYRKGYMTEKLGGLKVDDSKFIKQIEDFSDHTLDAGDRWPKGHEAYGLPKDGYTLLDIHGRRRAGAARLVGLPAPNLIWESVGMRHTTGLAAASFLYGF